MKADEKIYLTELKKRYLKRQRIIEASKIIDEEPEENNLTFML